MASSSDSFSSILRLALPSIVSNITVPLLGLVDLAIVGHIGTAPLIAAIAVGGMLFNVAYWLLAFVRMSAGGLTAQALGGRDLAEVVRVLRRSLAVGGGIGLAMVLLQVPLADGGLWLMAPDADVLPLARRYVLIVVWGAPAVLMQYGLTGWFVGMQNTRAPMVVAIFQNLVNIAVSLALVFAFGLGLEGVAAGTVAAQWTALALALLLLRRYRKLWRGRHVGQTFTPEAARRFFSLNRDIFLRSLCLVGVTLFFTAAGSREGALTLAANTLLLELYTLFSYFTDGFAYAGEALCGRRYGAGDMAGLRLTVRSLLAVGWPMAVAFTVAYAVGGVPFLRLLTSDAAVVSAARPYLCWAVAVPLAGVAAFLLDGVFVGVTATRALLLSAFGAAVAFFAIFFSLRATLGNHALWLAFVAFLATRGLVSWAVCRRALHF